MTSLRFRSRHLHATFVDDIKTRLTALNWMGPNVNFGAKAVTVVDFQPDERNAPVALNTIAVSLGDYAYDEDEELGARGGGLRSAPYAVFVDAYMAEQSLALAICDEIRDIYTDRSLPLIDQVTGNPVPGQIIEIENIIGPERPPAQVGAEVFKRFWRTMRIDARLFYPS